jgi:hypothetical protein
LHTAALGIREKAAPFAKSLRTRRWRDMEKRFVRKLNVADLSATPQAPQE